MTKIFRTMDYEKEILSIVNQFKGKLSDEDMDSIVELATHLEWGVALEILCDQLYEYEIGINSSTYDKISRLKNMMDVNIDLKLLQSLVIQDGD
ncbi:MAG: hypothetical protein A2X86_12815 [Bdellovibrionales bacterium GWA2_49_15]|nr:MAG: hypothetical protein A2X86_12815 [Bdellovibrionales bacterium GWA2_49_15]HAZ14735.1 hypothetical protein [Bdellovibrionales bacterium]